VREALATGAITEGHARAILMANGESPRLQLLERVLADHLSVRDTEALARKLNAGPTRATPVDTPPDPDVERLEDAFRQALGTRVRLLRGRRGGRLVISFFSDEELQGIYEAITGRDRAR
jgi:ParB family chromosome partitioning protein